MGATSSPRTLRRRARGRSLRRWASRARATRSARCPRAPHLPARCARPDRPRRPGRHGLFPTETLRRAAGAARRELTGASSVAARAARRPTSAEVAAIAEGALLGAYSFTRYRARRRPGRKAPSGVSTIEILTSLARESQGQGRGRARRDRSPPPCTATRDLVNTAPNDLYPAAFADIAQGRGQGHGRQGDRARREGARGRRLRRPPRRRAGLVARPAPGQGLLLPVAPERQGRARRQGHHVRLGWHLDQAGRGHGGHEVRHGRRRRRPAHRRSPREARACPSP